MHVFHCVINVVDVPNNVSYGYNPNQQMVGGNNRIMSSYGGYNAGNVGGNVAGGGGGGGYMNNKTAKPPVVKDSFNFVQDAMKSSVKK